MDRTHTLCVAVIGAGYWGPNLARNFAASPDWTLSAICDRDGDRAHALASKYIDCDAETSLERLLARDDLDAVAIATPAGTHHAIGIAAMRAGKHVVVEKPLAHSIAAGGDLVREAARAGTTLMIDHTFCYTPVVTKIRDLIAAGELGDILFVDSVRINLGLVQPDVDVFWDLAPHDLAILDFVLPQGLPTSVSAHGADPIGAGKNCVGHLMLPLPGGGLASIHVNWLSPTKIRTMTIGGTRRTMVWNDMNPQQRLSVYDRGVSLDSQSAVALGHAERHAAKVSYRLGDTWSPALPETEALGAMVAEFAAAIREHRPPLTDGRAGLRVLDLLQQASAPRAVAA